MALAEDMVRDPLAGMKEEKKIELAKRRYDRYIANLRETVESGLKAITEMEQLVKQITFEDDDARNQLADKIAELAALLPDASGMESFSHLIAPNKKHLAEAQAWEDFLD